MTKTTITRWFISAVLLFGALIAFGVIISINDTTENRIVFSTYKDLMPLAIAIVAAWLGFCVQRRSAYLQHLRTIWSKLIDAVQSALQYTHLAKPTQENYSQTLMKMSVAVDEIRGVFCNLGENDRGGLYPFEPIKTIHELIVELKYGDNFQVAKTEETRRHILALWKDVRTELLKEFDREVPTWHHSHWEDAEKGRVYDDHGIPRKAT